MTSWEMAAIPLTVVGCDFRCAATQWRSRLVLDQRQAVEFFERLKQNRAADGLVDLNTCNRNEWIVSGPDPNWAAELLRTQMIDRVGQDALSWFSPYVYIGEQAARHIFRVAIGQESLVVGERQIAGQLQQALVAARQRKTSSRVLNGLGTVAGRLVRIALRRGCIESAAVGVHALAVSYLEHHLPAEVPLRVAVVGMGQIGKRVLGMLQQNPWVRITCCNRTVSNDSDLKIMPLDRLNHILADSDAAIVCTGAMQPIVRSEHLEYVSEQKKMLLIDIGIPRQIEDDLDHPGVTAVGLDDLTGFYNQRACSRPASFHTQEQAEKLVDRALEEYEAYCRERPFSNVMDIVQKNHRQLVGEEIPRLIADTLDYLPQEARLRLETDLKNIILEYTNEIFYTIKESLKRNGEEHKTE